MDLEKYEDLYVATMAVDITMKEHGITVAQFKKVMFNLPDLETVEEAKSLVDSDNNLTGEYKDPSRSV